MNSLYLTLEKGCHNIHGYNRALIKYAIFLFNLTLNDVEYNHQQSLQL
jgi:hypothetical protein